MTSRPLSRAALLAALALTGAAVPAQAAMPQGVRAAAAPRQEAYSTLLRDAGGGLVSRVAIDSETGVITVTNRDGSTAAVQAPPDTGALAQRLTADGVTVTYSTTAPVDSSSGSGSSTWPMLLSIGSLFGLVAFLMLLAHRRSRRAAAVTAAAAQAQAAAQPAVSFADVAGCDEAVDELRDVLGFLTEPERFERLGAKPPSGIILHGEPGTGKTLLAKALAGEAGVPFFAMSGSDFVEMYVGVGAKRVRELFATARRSEAGAVVFIDEIDAIGRRRSQSGTGGNQESENTLNALLVELDGFQGRRGVITIAATNRLDMLDPALLRPGRFGLQIQVTLPDEPGRRRILELYAAGKPLAADVDLDSLATYTAGCSGAQLADMLNQAAIVAARAGRDEVTDADLREGHLRVLAGPERASSSLRPEERRLVAWHEAGHVLAAELLDSQDKAQRVTIRPRGQAAGLAVYGQTDRALHSPRYFHERMICILAGRAAEQQLCGEISSGAANDLQQANMLARRAVVELGFSDRVGQLIGHTQGQDIGLSQRTRHVVDEEVARLVGDAYHDAVELMGDHRALLDRLAETLLQHGQLERVDIALCLGEQPPR
ncbi:MAG TPA: AAA family ATPase, partial [Thermoleophilia bacterium]|nr:AAA family ATPase [Thermoleophilia bacterium]